LRTLPSGELSANPVELATDVADDVAGPQVVRQHVPGVGLDLDLTRQGLCLVTPVRVLDREARGPEDAEILEEDRDVEGGAPLAGPRVLLPGDERVWAQSSPGCTSVEQVR